MRMMRMMRKKMIWKIYKKMKMMTKIVKKFYLKRIIRINKISLTVKNRIKVKIRKINR
jgi:hypothetical protein